MRQAEQAEDAIALALESDTREDSEVQVVVQALDRGGSNASDVGICHISLENLLEEGRDIKAKAMPILDNDKNNLGTLTVTCIALKALQAIDEEADAAGPSSETLSLTVEEVTMAKPPKGQKLTLTVDLLYREQSLATYLAVRG